MLAHLITWKRPGNPVTRVLRHSVLSAALLAAASTLIARDVGPSDRGRIAGIIAIGSIIVTVCSGGFDVALRTLLPGSVDWRGTARHYNWLARRAMVACAVIGAPVAVLVYSIWIDQPGFAVAGLTVAMLLSTLFLAFARAAVYAVGGSASTTRAEAVANFALVIGVFVVVIFGVGTLQVYLGCYLASSALACVLHVRLLRKDDWPVEQSVSDDPIVRRGLQSLAAAIGMVLTYRIDRLILGAVAGPAVLGRYAVAVSLAELTTLLPTAVAQVALQDIARERSGSGNETAWSTKRLYKPFAVAVGGTAVLALVLALVAPMVIDLVFGPGYRETIGPLRILLLASIPMAAWRLLGTDLAARGRFSLQVACSWTAVVATITTCFVLVPRYGAEGAAAASLIAYAVVVAIAAFASLKVGVLGELLRAHVR